MVIGWRTRAGSAQGGPAWMQVEAAQRDVMLPCLLVPQPAHAALAGEIAEALLPEAFGELPAEVRQAIKLHDTGWSMSDAQQIQRLRADGERQRGGAGSSQGTGSSPVSFVSISPREAVETWAGSIRTVEALSKVGGIIVSRHFTLLATAGGAEHERFHAAETARRKPMEQSSGLAQEDLQRWTAALGFCDVMSLFLVSGIEGEAELPLAHPASPEAKDAPKVRLRREGERVELTPLGQQGGRMLQSGTVLELQGLVHPVPAKGGRAEALRWQIA